MTEFHEIDTRQVAAAGGGDATARRWGIFAEFYTGPSPYGQFFREKVRLAGFGIHFGGF